MRDDERYPIEIQSCPDSELPQVAPDSSQDRYGNRQDKFIIPDEAAKAVDGEVKADTGEEQADRRATICGFRRRTFLIVAVVIALLAIGALVGGLVGGLKAQTRSHSSGGSASTSAPVPSPTGPLDPAKRGLAAATTSGTKNSTLQVFYQDLDTTDIFYRLVWADKVKEAQRADLKIPPNQGTPLAVTAANSTDSDGIDVNLFYLSANNASEAVIVQATLECTHGAGSCSTTSNQAISSGFENGINPDSGLAAVLLNNNATRFRVYFQASKGVIWALVGDDPAKHGWSPQRIGGPGAEGTSIAASLGEKPGTLLVAYVFANTGTLQTVEYTDSLGADAGHDVYSKAGSGFVTTSRLSACFASAVDTYHIYYVGHTTGDIVGYFRVGTAADWKPNHDKAWGRADGGIACVAWEDQTRMLYMMGGKLAMNEQDNATWSKAEIL